MEQLKEKIAYLEGMAEGLDLQGESQSGLLIRDMLFVLRDMAETIAALQNGQQEIEEYIRTVDEDLTDLENEVYGELEAEGLFDDEGDDLIALDCTNCGENLCLEESDLEEGEIVCPNCHETIYIDQRYLMIGEDDPEYLNDYQERKRGNY